MKSARAKGWFGHDNERLEEMFCTREPDNYTKLYKINIEGQDMETYQIFVVLQASMPSNRHKTINMAHQSLQQKLILTQLTKKGN